MCSEANKDRPWDTLSMELRLFSFALFGTGSAGLGRDARFPH